MQLRISLEYGGFVASVSPGGVSSGVGCASSLSTSFGRGMAVYSMYDAHPDLERPDTCETSSVAGPAATCLARKAARLRELGK